MVREIKPRAAARLHGQHVIHRLVALQVARREFILRRDVAEVALQHGRQLKPLSPGTRLGNDSAAADLGDAQVGDFAAAEGVNSARRSIIAAKDRHRLHPAADDVLELFNGGGRDDRLRQPGPAAPASKAAFTKRSTCGFELNLILDALCTSRLK